MSGHGSKMGQKKEEAILRLLSARSVEDAARSIGVSSKTLFRWLKKPEFEVAYRQARKEMWLQAMARLQQGLGPAVTTILRVMVDPAVPPATKVKAASCVMNLVANWMVDEELEARVAGLERALEPSTSDQPDDQTR